MKTFTEVIIQDLLETTVQETQQIPIPYNISDSQELQISQTYYSIKHAIRTRKRIKSLVYAYYLGELLENLSNRSQQTMLLRRITKYHKLASRRIYYIFLTNGIEQIWKTKKITLNIVYKLSFTDYQMIIL